MSIWLSDSTANRINKTYFKGFVDISDGNLFVRKGDISLNGRFFSNGDVSINQRLFVSGDVSLNGNVVIGKDILILGRLSVQQYSSKNIITTTTTNYNFIVSEDFSLNNSLFVGGDVSLNKRLYVANSIFIGISDSTLNLDVSGSTALRGDLSLNKRLFVGGDVSFNKRLYIGYDSSINGNLTVTLNVRAQSFHATSDYRIKDFTKEALVRVKLDF